MNQGARDKIIDTAERLFIARGYSQVSIGQIVQEARISKGGFYHHFFSKKELLDAIIDKHLGQLTGQLKEIAKDRNLTALEKLEQYIVAGWNVAKPREKLFLELLQNFNDPIVNEEVYSKIRKESLPFFVEIVEQGIWEGKMKSATPAETVDLLMMLKRSFASLPSEVLNDRQKIFKYFIAFQDIFEKSLGLEEGFFAKHLPLSSDLPDRRVANKN